MDIQRPELRQRRQRRRLLLGGAGLLVVLVGGVLLAGVEPAAPRVERDTLWLGTVERGEMLRAVRGPGTLVPREIRWLSAATPGRVERIVVRPGAPVTTDTVIVKLSNPELVEQHDAARFARSAAEADLSARRMTLESQLLDQRADLAGVRAQHESARLQAEAEHELAEKGIIPMLQYRRSQLLVDELAIRLDIERERIEKFEQTIEAQLLAEQARVEQLRNAEDLRRRQVMALDVRSPIAGILQQLAVEEGQQVAAGANLARVARPDDLVAELRVPETLAKDVRLGQRVTVDTRNGEAPGEVIRIDPAVRNGTVTVEAGFDGALPEGARPDLSVDGTIEIERLDDVLYVGRPAFGQPGETTTMFRLGPDGEAARRVPVRLGRASVSVIEIVEGLRAGDRVVLSDTSAWDESDRLRLD